MDDHGNPRRVVSLGNSRQSDYAMACLSGDIGILAWIQIALERPGVPCGLHKARS